MELTGCHRAPVNHISPTARRHIATLHIFLSWGAQKVIAYSYRWRGFRLYHGYLLFWGFLVFIREAPNQAAMLSSSSVSSTVCSGCLFPESRQRTYHPKHTKKFIPSRIITCSSGSQFFCSSFSVPWSLINAQFLKSAQMPEQALGASENPTFSFVFGVTWLFVVYDKVVRLIAVRAEFIGVLQNTDLCSCGHGNVMLHVQMLTDSNLIKCVTEPVLLLNL